MRKPDQIRRIFAELRQTLGSEIPAADLLKLAFHLFRAYSEDEFEKLEESGPTPSLMTMPVDVAMRDGGWRVLEFETENEAKLDSLDRESFELLRFLVSKYLGSEWLNRRLTDQLSQ